MPLTIAPLGESDRMGWERLWAENTRGACAATVTGSVWSALLSEDRPLYGLGAQEEGRLVGMLHYVLHPATASLEPACLMQDLYVDPAFRRRGIGHALVADLIARGHGARWCRILWMVEAGNSAAQALYRPLAGRIDFAVYGLIP